MIQCLLMNYLQLYYCYLLIPRAERVSMCYYLLLFVTICSFTILFTRARGSTSPRSRRASAATPTAPRRPGACGYYIMYIYICIDRERERERDTCIYIYIYTFSERNKLNITQGAHLAYYLSAGLEHADIIHVICYCY